MASVRIGFVKSSGILVSKAEKKRFFKSVNKQLNLKRNKYFLCENGLQGDNVVVWLDDADWA